MNDEGVSPINGGIGVAIGLMVFVAIFLIVPGIGFNIYGSATIGDTSCWGCAPTNYTVLPTGVDLLGPCVSLLFFIAMISIIVRLLPIFGKQSDKEDE